MSAETEAVLGANRAFYEAFQAMDIDAMAACWCREPSDVCVHPGWEPLKGWLEIRQSWRSIFANTGFMRVDLSDLSVVVAGDVAWVSCAENLFTVVESRTVQGRVVATNVFRRLDGAWRMSLHHGSSVAHTTRPGPEVGSA